MSDMPRVAIRADGDSALGLGHLRRCWTLAKALIQVGYDVRFVRQCRVDGISEFGSDVPTSWIEDTASMVQRADDPGGEAKDADATLSIIGDSTNEMSWVVVDHYSLNSRWEAKVREAGHRILAIDDLRDRRHCADVLVSDSPDPFEQSLNECPTEPVQLVGFPYAILDAEFTFDDGGGIQSSELANLLVTFGGSDPTGETAKVYRALQELRESRGEPQTFGYVDVVVGPGNPAPQSLTELIDYSPCARVHLSPPSLAPLMRHADLVITSGGNTMVEALALRKPCLVIVTATNQQLLTEQLLARNLVKVVGWHMAVGTVEIKSALVSLFNDLPAFATRIRETPVFDNLGCHRIALAMREMNATGRPAFAPGNAGTA